jgi:hypothetical protein
MRKFFSILFVKIALLFVRLSLSVHPTKTAAAIRFLCRDYEGYEVSAKRVGHPTTLEEDPIAWNFYFYQYRIGEDLPDRIQSVMGKVFSQLDSMPIYLDNATEKLLDDHYKKTCGEKSIGGNE